MRSVTLLGLAATASAGHISIPFSRQRFSHPSSTHAKRQDGEPVSLEALNNITGGGYYSEVEIGTPGQRISFLLDTGSSDTWVNSVEADLCQDVTMQELMGYCQTQFDPENSSTFESVSRGVFDITYLDERNIQGQYFEDTVTIGDVAIEGQQLGLALKSVRPTGIMGLGFSANVAARREYPTVLDNMVSQGFIDTPAYSLYLNDLSSDEGSILFGGIDTEKFIGDLALLPLVSDFQSLREDITSFNVRISGFSLESPPGERNLNIFSLESNAILDSGSTICLLPDDQVQPIHEGFGVLSFTGILAPFIDCAYAGEKGDGYIFEFNFGDTNITVPMDEMVIDAYADVQDILFEDPQLAQLFRGWEGACMFGIGSTANFGFTSSDFTLLGATFLRSAYVVYDLANEQIGIAQANLNATDSNIVEIKEGDLPDVTGVRAQQTTASTTETATETAKETATSTATGTATETDTETNTATQVGIASSSPSQTSSNDSTDDQADSGSDDQGSGSRSTILGQALLVTLAAVMGLAVL